MNSERSVRSTPSRTSFCTASMRNSRMMTSSANASGNSLSTLAACDDLTLEITTATVCGCSFFR